MDTYALRVRIAKPYLVGDGIEIGAGSNPHPGLPGTTYHVFDKRTREEVSKYCGVPIDNIPQVRPMEDIPKVFPNGANYLIANHVIEHLSNPIKDLIEWFSYVKEGGYLILSVPYVSNCPDKGRPVASIEHLFLDYALNRNDASFDSREHAYSFLMAWIDVGMNVGKDKFEVATIAHQQASLEKNDIHWHTFTGESFKELILLTALLSKRGLRILEFFCPENSEATDILCTCQLDRNIPTSLEIVKIQNKVRLIVENINKVKSKAYI